MNLYIKHIDELMEIAQNMWLPKFHAIQNIAGNDAVVEFAHDIITQANKQSIDKVTTCSKGCSFCCHEKIPTSQIEADRINSYIKKNRIAPDKLRLKKQRTAKDFDTLKWKTKACSFVDKDGACKIYEVRPAVCRTHNSTIDPKFCNKSNYPNYTIREVKVLEIEAIVFAILLLGTDSNADQLSQPNFLHELL